MHQRPESVAHCRTLGQENADDDSRHLHDCQQREEVGLDLEAGYLVKERVGRNNRYTVHGEFPLRHPLNDKATVADLLAIFN